MRRFAGVALCAAVGLLLACSEAAVRPEGGAGSGGGGGGSGGSAGSGSGGSAGSVVAPGWDGTGTWTSADGPPGFWQTELFAGGEDALFALGVRDLLRSEDGGASWVPVAPAASGVGRFAEAGTSLLFDDGEQLRRSTDGGATWTAVGPAVTSLRADGTTLFATRRNDEDREVLLRSDDGGETWAARGPLPANFTYASALWARDGVLLLAVQSGPEAGLHRSEDAGGSWSRVEGADVLAGAADFAAIGNISFALVSSGGIHRSYDAGRTWAVVPVPQQRARIAFRGFVRAAGRLFASTGDGVYFWDEANGEWLTAASPLPAGLTSLAGTGEALFAAGRETLWRWDDKGLRFDPVEIGFAGTRLSAIAAGAGARFATTLDGTVFRGTPAGWEAVPELSRTQGLTWIADDFWLGDGPEALWYSLDGGETFLRNDAIFGRDANLVDFVGAPDALFVLADGIPAFSDNYGRAWRLLGDAMPEAGGGPVRFARIGLSGDRLFGTDGVRRTWYSDDRGQAWTLAADAALRDFVTVDGAMYAAGWGAAWRSLDRGATWEQRPGVLPDCTLLARLGAVEGVLVAALRGTCDDAAPEANRTLWTSLDGGATWAPAATPLPAPVSDFARDGDAIWVATDGAGAWKLSIE